MFKQDVSVLGTGVGVQVGNPTGVGVHVGTPFGQQPDPYTFPSPYSYPYSFGDTTEDDVVDDEEEEDLAASSDTTTESSSSESSTDEEDITLAPAPGRPLYNPATPSATAIDDNAFWGERNTQRPLYAAEASQAPFKVTTSRPSAKVQRGRVYSLTPGIWNTREKRVAFMERLYKEFFSLGEDYRPLAQFLREDHAFMEAKTVTERTQILQRMYEGNADLVVIRPENIGWVADSVRADVEELVEWVVTFFVVVANESTAEALRIVGDSDGDLFGFLRTVAQFIEVSESSKKDVFKDVVEIDETSRGFIQHLTNALMSGKKDASEEKPAHAHLLTLQDLLRIEYTFVNNLFFFEQQSLADLEEQLTAKERSSGYRDPSVEGRASAIRNIFGKVISSVSRGNGGKRGTLVMLPQDDRSSLILPAQPAQRKLYVDTPQSSYAWEAVRGSLPRADAPQQQQQQAKGYSDGPQLPSPLPPPLVAKGAKEEEGMVGLPLVPPPVGFLGVPVTPEETYAATPYTMMYGESTFRVSKANAKQVLAIQPTNKGGNWAHRKHDTVYRILTTDLIPYYNLQYFADRQARLVAPKGIFSSTPAIRANYARRYLVDSEASSLSVYIHTNLGGLAERYVAQVSADWKTNRQGNPGSNASLVGHVHFYRALISTARARNALQFPRHSKISKGPENQELLEVARAAAKLSGRVPSREEEIRLAGYLTGVLNYSWETLQEFSNNREADVQTFLLGASSQGVLYMLSREQAEAVATWYQALDGTSYEKDARVDALPATSRLGRFTRKLKPLSAWDKYVENVSVLDHFYLCTGLWRLWYMLRQFTHDVESMLGVEAEGYRSLPLTTPDITAYVLPPDRELGVHTTDKVLQFVLARPQYTPQLQQIPPSAIYAPIPGKPQQDYPLPPNPTYGTLPDDASGYQQSPRIARGGQHSSGYVALPPVRRTKTGKPPQPLYAGLPPPESGTNYGTMPEELY